MSTMLHRLPEKDRSTQVVQKYEELISETGEALDLGAEVETYGEMEGASGDQDMDIPNSVDTNTDTDTTITHRIATLV